MQVVQVEVSVPVEGVWVETLYYERTRVRLVSQLMDHDPLFIFPYYSDLCEREWNKETDDFIFTLY